MSARVIALALAGFGASVLLAVLAFDASWPVRILAAIVALYLATSLFLHPRYNLIRDPFSLHNLSRVNLLFGYVFSCLYVANASLRVDEHLIILALAIGLVTALLSDILIMFVPPTTALPEDRSDRNHSTVMRFFVVLFLAGWLWRIYAFSQGMLQGTLIGTKLELSGASNAIGALSGLATVAMWGCVVFAVRPLRCAPLVLLEIGWLLLTGSKAATMYILIPFMLVLYWRDIIRVDTRFVGVASMLIVLFLGSFVVIHGYRVAVARQLLDAGYEQLDPLAAVGDIEISGDDFGLVGRSMSERLNFGERFLLILERDQQKPKSPWLGTSYLTALTWAVPRAVWPDKPPMSLGRFFATEYLGWGEESRSEAGITLWGEAYLNFGILGALVIPAVWMAGLQMIYGFSLRLGRWGLLFLASGFMLMVNSLSANVAMPLAALAQLAVQIVVFAMIVSVIRVGGRRLEVRLNG